MRLTTGFLLLATTIPAACSPPEAKKPDVPKAEASVQRDLDRVERIQLQARRPKKFIESVATDRIKAWKASAARGEPAGMYLLALAHAYGAGVPQDDKETVRLYQQAGAKGLRVGFFGLSGRLLNGKGIAADPARGVSVLASAAELDLPPAMAHLGASYLAGSGIGKDAARAKSLFRRAAALGSVAGRAGWTYVNEAEFKAPAPDATLPDPVFPLASAERLHCAAFEKKFRADDETVVNDVAAAAVNLARGEVTLNSKSSLQTQDEFLSAILAADQGISSELFDQQHKISDYCVAAYKEADRNGWTFDMIMDIGKLGSVGGRIGNAGTMMATLSSPTEVLKKGYDEQFGIWSRTLGADSFLLAEFALQTGLVLREGGEYDAADRCIRQALSIFEKSPQTSYSMRAECWMELADLHRFQGRTAEVRKSLSETTRLLARLYDWQRKNLDANSQSLRVTRSRLLFAESMQPL